MLLENIGLELDPVLEPVLTQQVKISGGSKQINIGERWIDYSDTFKFFLTSTNPNPHYSPEVSVKVTIINFAVTKIGLKDQML
jgi:dynein heavy chain